MGRRSECKAPRRWAAITEPGTRAVRILNIDRFCSYPRAIHTTRGLSTITELLKWRLFRRFAALNGGGTSVIDPHGEHRLLVPKVVNNWGKCGWSLWRRNRTCSFWPEVSSRPSPTCHGARRSSVQSCASTSERRYRRRSWSRLGRPCQNSIDVGRTTYPPQWPGRGTESPS